MATYYVAQLNGNDANDGLSLGYPFKSLHYAFNQLEAGDTLYMRGGYDFREMGSSSTGISVSSINGTSGSHITVTNYNNESVTLDCQDLTANSQRIGLNMDGCDYWDITGLNIKGVTDSPPEEYDYPGPGMEIVDCTNITFTLCSVHDCANGFITYQGDEIHYINCDSYQNADTKDGGDLANGFYTRVTDGSSIYYEGCKAWLNSDDGWDCFVSGTTMGDGFILWNNCWAFENGHWGAITGNGAGFKSGKTTAEATGGVQRVFTNCLSINNDGIGFDESQDQTDGYSIPHTIFNCISAGNGDVAFNFRDDEGASSSEHVDIIRNCISYDESLSWTGFGNNTVDHNSWQDSISFSSADFVSVDYSELHTARKASGDLPDIGLFQLVDDTGELYQAGVNVSLTNDGRGNPYLNPPSIEAFEYGSSTFIPVTSITVTGAGSATTITVDNGTLQMEAAILPVNATNQTVAWYKTNGTGEAVISSSGLLTAISDGIVVPRAVATDGSGVYDEIDITISNQAANIYVTSIVVSDLGGGVITINQGTLQMSATVYPFNATVKTYTWSVVAGTGTASISAGGLLTAITDGTVTARATATDGSAIAGDKEITISNQTTSYSSLLDGIVSYWPLDELSGTFYDRVGVNHLDHIIGVEHDVNTGNGQGALFIVEDDSANYYGSGINPSQGASLALWCKFDVLPSSTLNDQYLFRLTCSGSPYETFAVKLRDIDSKFRFLVNDEDDNQLNVVTSGAAVTGLLYHVVCVAEVGAAIRIYINNVRTNSGEGNLAAALHLTDEQVCIGNGYAGDIRAAGAGINKVHFWNRPLTDAEVDDLFGGLVWPFLVTIPVTSITVTGAGSATTITTNEGTLQMSAAVLPVDATDDSVTWSVIAGTGLGTIDSSGLLTADINGTVTVRAAANDGSGIYGEIVITFSNQDIVYKNIAPIGWHVPIQTDFETLVSYIGGYTHGGDLKETGTDSWLTPNTGATNTTGFTAKGSGYRGGSDGVFYYLKRFLFLQSSTALVNKAQGLSLNNTTGDASYAQDAEGFNSGYPICCIKDSASLTHGQTSTVTDIDGNVYPTICIGTQEWMAVNLKVTRYNDGTLIPEITGNAAWVALTTGGRCWYNNTE